MKEIGKFKITFVKHPSAKSLVLGFFRKDFPELADDEILKEETDFTLHLTETVNCAKVSEVIHVVNKTKLWGFCKHIAKNPNHKEIHYWFDKDADKIKLVELFTHELAHAIGYKSELIAQKIGAVGAIAYQTLLEQEK